MPSPHHSPTRSRRVRQSKDTRPRPTAASSERTPRPGPRSPHARGSTPVLASSSGRAPPPAGRRCTSSDTGSRREGSPTSPPGRRRRLRMSRIGGSISLRDGNNGEAPPPPDQRCSAADTRRGCADRPPFPLGISPHQRTPARSRSKSVRASSVVPGQLPDGRPGFSPSIVSCAAPSPFPRDRRHCSCPKQRASGLRAAPPLPSSTSVTTAPAQLRR
jgi:hypothetical protein